MTWHQTKIWHPNIDMSLCTNCGSCRNVCPNSLGNLREYGQKAWIQKDRFGLDGNGFSYAITHETSENDRIKSASGGTSTLLLKYLLDSKKVDCVICPEPLMAKIGEPHFGLRICLDSKDVDACRSSAYGPLRYDMALKQVIDNNLTCAITALPCILRSINKLPDELRKNILFTIGIVCSHNVTDQFCDFMARNHGIKNETFKINFRDKIGIQDANQFNTVFHLEDGRQLRTPRLKNGFTPFWRNYSFAQEACFYCPDFFASDADISVKDAWGRLSKNPLGLTLCIIRNREVAEILSHLSDKGSLSIEMCDQDELLDSQRATATYKHIHIWGRWFDHPDLRPEVITLSQGQPFSPDKKNRKDFKKKLKQSRLTQRLYSKSIQFGHLFLLWKESAQNTISILNSVTLRVLYLLIRFFVTFTRSLLRLFYIASPYRYRPSEGGPCRVLINSGSGYGNVGDEAQLGANINRWSKLIPGCEINVFSPNPSYTRNHHNVNAINGPRVVWFDANHNKNYGQSNKRFKLKFILTAAKMLTASTLMRAGFPTIFLKADEASLLYQLHRSDVLHISGGGFLTGMTLSRLWENMLLMKLAHSIGTQIILSGQTIGVFKTKTNRIIAKWGLKHARFIYLRDANESEEDVRALRLEACEIKSSFDDALFSDKAPHNDVTTCLKKNGIDIQKPFISAQFHYWGQAPDTQIKAARRFAELCDYLIDEFQVQILFIPMVQSDEEAERKVIQNMKNPSYLLDYQYDYKLARGIMAEAIITFTLKHHPIIFSLGEGVPAVAVSFDDYYYRKNKGALLNCNLEELCMDLKGFMGNEIIEVLNNAISNNNQLRDRINRWIDSVRKDENEIIHKFMEMNREIC